ncbi:hypothetical protein D3C86_1612650 [compost metagenome]
MRMQPTGKGTDVGVAPHPARKPGKGLVLPGRGAEPAYVAIDLPGVGPVRLHGNDGKAMALDQPAADGRTRAVEIRRAMAGLTDQDHASIAIAVEQFAEITGIDIR